MMRVAIILAAVLALAGCGGGGGGAGGSAPPLALATTSVTVRGTCTGTGTCTVVADGTSVPVAGDGAWSHAVDVSAGDRVVEIVMSVDGEVVARRQVSVTRQ